MIKAIFLSLTSFFLFLATSTYAANKNVIAQVEMIKGKATQLPPHSEMARSLQVGDELLEDTSILTSERSFVRIKFRDGSLMNVGSSSKIVLVEMTKSDVSLISLLKGKVRTKVLKDTQRDGENKFFIKTRSAALGVRGTDFQATYSPENKLTSLITLKGEVAMVKIDELNRKKLEVLEKAEDENVVERNEVTQKIEVESMPIDSTLQLNHLDKILSKDEAVLVKAGQYSGSSDALKKATIPVKINPTQFVILLKNEELNEKKVANLNPLPTLVASEGVENLMVDSKAPPEGFFDQRTGDFAPKAGGVVDLESGVYIAPDRTATFDDKNNVYVANKIGSIDQETGQYVAPKGLMLDKVKGFVVTDYAQDPALLSLKEDLNRESINKDLILGNEKDENFNLSNKFIKDEIQLLFLNGTMTRKVNRSNYDEIKRDTRSFYSFGVKWSMRSNNRFRPLLGLNFKKFKFDQDSRFVQGDHSAFDIYTGAQYAFSRNLNFLLHFGIKQDLFAVRSSGVPNSYSLVRMGVSELGVGVDWTWNISKKFNLYLKTLPYYSFSRDVGLVGAKQSLGHKLEISPIYHFDDIHAVNFGLSIDSGTKRTTSADGESKNEYQNGGLLISYQYQL